MAHEMTHDEVEAMLGAYALDATSRDEAAVVAAHLAGCERCRAEVAEHREVAALLASEPVEAPPGLWDRIVGGIGVDDAERGDRGDPKLPSIVTSTGARSQHPRGRGGLRSATPALVPRTRWRAVLVAAVLIAAAAIGAVVWRQQQRIDHANQQLARVEQAKPLAGAAVRAAKEPGARQVELRNGDGQPVARVVVLRDGTAYMTPKPAMAALSANRTYQLWAVTGHSKLSLGVLGADPAVTVFRVPAGTAALAVTAEQSPGVIASTNAPVAFAPLHGA